MTELSEKDIERYSRQLLLPAWGMNEQHRISTLHAHLSPRAEAVARYLVGAGIRKISFLGRRNSQLEKNLQALRPDLEISSADTYDFAAVYFDETESVKKSSKAPIFEIPETSPCLEHGRFPYLSAQATVAAVILRHFAFPVRGTPSLSTWSK